MEQLYRGDDMTRRVLLLSSVMLHGYGVSIVADEWAKELTTFGWNTVIGCLHQDENYLRNNIIKVGTDPIEILDLCQKLKIDLVVAQTTPYFELLPSISAYYPTIVFEHGDPSPFFFQHDAVEREQIRQNKIKNVYPHVSRVLASSYFLRHDIEWLTSSVVPLGCDHVADFGFKELPVESGTRPLKIGTLMRLGEGEALYKGVDLYAQLADFFKEDPSIEFQIMGRGEESDRQRWESLGVTTFLNSTDEERSTYLRDLDVLFSPSLWEGFNLPVVEAAASGTVGVAFDIGAHPETTPFLVRDLNDLRVLLETWIHDRALLSDASRTAYRFARSKFRWSESARGLAGHLDEVLNLNLLALGRRESAARRVLRVVKREGLVGFTKLIWSKFGVSVSRNRSE
jgi:glycosyltransferase involved in cell wall biosynthesis